MDKTDGTAVVADTPNKGPDTMQGVMNKMSTVVETLGENIMENMHANQESHVQQMDILGKLGCNGENGLVINIMI